MRSKTKSKPSNLVHTQVKLLAIQSSNSDNSIDSQSKDQDDRWTNHYNIGHHLTKTYRRVKILEADNKTLVHNSARLVLKVNQQRGIIERLSTIAVLTSGRLTDMAKIALEEDRYYRPVEWCLKNKERYFHEVDHEGWKRKFLQEYDQLQMLEESSVDEKTKLFHFEKIQRSMEFFKKLEEPKTIELVEEEKA